MRIVSWNVNGIRAAMTKGFCEKIARFDADIIGVQEIKANPSQIAEACKDIGGYHRFESSAVRPGYSGVALFTKQEPKQVFTSLSQERFDQEGRMVAALYDDFILANVYFPNGSGKNGDNSRVGYKLEFYEALFDFMDQFKLPKLVMGDFNIAHQEIDLARPKQNQNTSGFLPEERDQFTRVLERGYIDTFRHFSSEPEQYTWWNMRFKAREKNLGWRIDCILACKEAMPLVKRAFIWPEVLGSDHCPVGVDL